MLRTLHKPITILKRGRASLRYAMSQERAVTTTRSQTRTAHHRNNTISVLPTFRMASALQVQPRATAPDHLTVTVTAHRRSKSRHNSAQRAQVESHHDTLLTIGVNRAFDFLVHFVKIANRYQASADVFHHRRKKFGSFTSHIRASDTDLVSRLSSRACCGRETLRMTVRWPHMRHLERRSG
jgi:hypothetical protein